MGLKEELAEKLAGIDCQETIKQVLEERKDDIKEALYLDRKDKGVFDAVQEKVISRKLLVFAVATGLLYWGVGLDAETWGMIAMTYIGGQTAIDFAKVWRGADWLKKYWEWVAAGVVALFAFVLGRRGRNAALRKAEDVASLKEEEIETINQANEEKDEKKKLLSKE